MTQHVLTQTEMARMGGLAGAGNCLRRPAGKRPGNPIWLAP
jgi:hypothetical protein